MAMLTCQFCKKPLTKCRSDARGLCIKSPLSDGKPKPRTKAEKARDKRV